MWNVIYETVTGAGYALVWILILGYAFYKAMEESKERRNHEQR